MFYLASDIKIITSEVKTDQLSPLIISPQSIGIKITSVQMQSHNTAEWTIYRLFSLRWDHQGHQGETRQIALSTVTVSSSSTGRPGMSSFNTHFS